HAMQEDEFVRSHVAATHHEYRRLCIFEGFHSYAARCYFSLERRFCRDGGGCYWTTQTGRRFTPSHNGRDCGYDPDPSTRVHGQVACTWRAAVSNFAAAVPPRTAAETVSAALFEILAETAESCDLRRAIDGEGFTQKAFNPPSVFELNVADP